MRKISVFLFVFFLFVSSCGMNVYRGTTKSKIATTEDIHYYEQIKDSSDWINLIAMIDPSVDPSTFYNSMSLVCPMKLKYIYQEVCHGLSISVRGYHLRHLLLNPMIKKIYLCQEPFLLCRNLEAVSVGADHVWQKLDQQSKPITGLGIKVGMVDTGIDSKHGDFAPGGVGETEKILLAKNIAEPEESAEDLPFYPHGTHVGGIIAGNNPAKGDKKGIAYDANLFVYKVFSKKGTVQLADILGGIEQAIQDKVDIINLSIGFSSQNPIPSNPVGDPLYDAIQHGIKQGIVFCSAAGNNGARQTNNPWTLLAPGLFESVIQIAASDDRMGQLLTVQKDQKTLYTINASTSRHAPPFRTDMSGQALIDCGFGSIEDFEGKDMAGKIALISRGPKEKGILLSEKNLNAKKAGATGCIIYNYEDSLMKSAMIVVKEGANPEQFDFIPTLFISGVFATKLKSSLEEECSASYSSSNTSVISDFSSVGPCASGDKNVFKPDICFPGKQINSAILSVTSSQGKSEDRYDDWDGTSMSTAGTSGCVALIKQAHPEWTPKDIKLALMNNADILINPINQEVFPFFNQGSGQVNILQTIQTPILVDPPSWMSNVVEKSTLSSTFYATNISAETSTCSVTLETFNLRGKPSPFQLNPDPQAYQIQPKKTEEITLRVTIDPSLLTEDKYEGALWITVKNGNIQNESKIKLHVPFIFYQDKITTILPTVNELSITPELISVGKLSSISFTLNSGSCLNQNNQSTYLNHAQQASLLVIDSLGNEWGEIFYGENLFIGHYQILWDGKNTFGKEFLPDGSYELWMEISGTKPSRYWVGEFRIKGSSLPKKPLLIVSSVTNQTLNQSFPIDLYLDNPDGLNQVKLHLSFSKKYCEPVLYTLNDVAIISSSAKSTMKEGEFSFEVDLRETKQKRIKLATLLLTPHRSSSNKSGIQLKLEKLEMIGNNQQVVRCDASVPLVKVDANPVLVVDFNQDNFVDYSDYDMLMSHYLQDYLTDRWDPAFDLNNDLLVNILDVMILAGRFNL